MQIVIYLICVLYEATWAEKNVLTSASESGVYFYGETAERVMNILLKGNQRNILPSVPRPKDCSYLDKKFDKSGVYKIYPDNGTRFDVFCEMEVDGGGWTVFVKRMDGSESFDRKWKEYENGFGNLKKEFWLGDALKYHNGLPFSTKDNDNDSARNGNCAMTLSGGWWFHWCDHVCFTLYHRRNGKKGEQLIKWETWKDSMYSLETASMMIRTK